VIEGKDALHKATVALGASANMADSRTSEAASEAASGGTGCTCCDHADHAAAKLQMRESWIEECGKLVGKKASAFERWLP
jgi:hypothetical protein